MGSAGVITSWIARGRPGYGVAASVPAAYCYCVHSRGSKSPEICFFTWT